MLLEAILGARFGPRPFGGWWTPTLGLSFGGIASAPWLADVINTIGKTGMAVGGFLAFILDNTIPGTHEERGLIAWMSNGDSDAEAASSADAVEPDPT